MVGDRANGLPDAEFIAWIRSLAFVIDPVDLEAVRRACDHLARMTEMNRAPTTRAGADE
jgi:hypothetical protein